MNHLGPSDVWPHANEKLGVGRPPPVREQRGPGRLQIAQRATEREQPVEAKARVRVTALFRDGGRRGEDPRRQPGEPPGAGRPIPIGCHRHEVRPAFEPFHHVGNRLRRVGEVRLKRHQRVSLGVVRSIDRIADQPLQARRVPDPGLVGRDGQG